MKGILKTIFTVFLIVAAFFVVRHFDIHEVIPSSVKRTDAVGAGIIRNEEIVINRNFDGTIDDIISFANQAREEQGLKTLGKNEKLNQSALAKAQDMKGKEYFEHVSPEGLQPWFFVEEAGYKYQAVGENLAEGYFSAISVHEAWMGSEGHRENIISDKFEEIGIAIVEFEQNGRRSYIIVQHFGSVLNEQEIEVIVCEEKAKKSCEDAEEKEDEVKDTIKKQKKIIKDAKKHDADKKDLEEAEDNLKKLEEIKDEIEDYLDRCEDYFKECDKWI